MCAETGHVNGKRRPYMKVFQNIIPFDIVLQLVAEFSRQQA